MTTLAPDPAGQPDVSDNGEIAPAGLAPDAGLAGWVRARDDRRAETAPVPPVPPAPEVARPGPPPGPAGPIPQAPPRSAPAHVAAAADDDLPEGWWNEPAPTAPPERPPVPAPPAPLVADARRPSGGGVVPDRSAPPPRHARPAGPVAVPGEQDADGDGWPDEPALEEKRPPSTNPRRRPTPTPTPEPEPTRSRRPSLSGVAGRWRSKRPAYRWLSFVAALILTVLLIILVVELTISALGGGIAKGLAVPIDNQTKTIVSAVGEMNSPVPANIIVSSPLSWLPCPLTPDAKKMIGFDPPEGPTLNGQRASYVDQKAQGWLRTNKPSELRISTPDATHIAVFVLPTDLGVPLIDCLAEQTETPGATRTPSTGPTPAPSGVQSTTPSSGPSTPSSRPSLSGGGGS